MINFNFAIRSPFQRNYSSNKKHFSRYGHASFGDNWVLEYGVQDVRSLFSLGIRTEVTGDHKGIFLDFCLFHLFCEVNLYDARHNREFYEKFT